MEPDLSLFSVKIVTFDKDSPWDSLVVLNHGFHRGMADLVWFSHRKRGHSTLFMIQWQSALAVEACATC